MNQYHSAYLLIVIGLVTMLTRFLPFMVFSGNRPIPKYIKYLGDVLPYAIIAMLVVYCFKGVDITNLGSVLPQALAVLITVVLHIIKRNSLLSIGVGTLSYIILINYVI